jgi:microcystin-dependent protein
VLQGAAAAGSVGTAMNVSGTTAVATMQSNAAATGISIVAAATGVSIIGAVTGASVVNAPTGGGGAHNNMPPTIMVNYIIRVL